MERKLNLYKKRMIEISAKIAADIITTLIIYNIIPCVLFIQTHTYTPLHILYVQLLQDFIQNKNAIIESLQITTYSFQLALYSVCFISSLAYILHAICYVALLIAYIHTYIHFIKPIKQSNERNFTQHE